MKRLLTLLAVVGIGFSYQYGIAGTASISTVSTFTGVRKQISLPYSSTGGTWTFKLYKAPVSGKLEYFDTASGTYKVITLTTSTTTRIWYYTSNPGFVGGDVFQWTGTDSAGSDTAKCQLEIKADLYGKDWPQFRYDEHRNAASAMQLADNLQLQWTWQFPAQEAAWKRSVLQFDQGYEPIVMGKTLFVGSNASDRLLALDTTTGAEKWRFYTGAPIRFAPVATNGKVYVASDDGYLYCVDAATGAEVWKFRAGPTDQQAFGNRRMTSAWPIRGGPVLGSDGLIYFACGLMPSEGVFVYAMNPATGAVVWKNDHSGTMTVDQPHAAAAVTGLSPQGYLVMNRAKTRVMVPSGHAMPGMFDRLTGLLDQPWDQGGTRNKNGAAVYVTADGVCIPPSAKIAVGSKEYTTGPGVTDVVHTLIAGDDRLFVVTKTGKLYCFGASAVSSPPARSFSTTALPASSDHWKTEVTNMLAGLGDPEGSCVVMGIGSGRLIEELAKQSKLQIDVFESDLVKANALRRKLDDAGLHGGRMAKWMPGYVVFTDGIATWVPEKYRDDTAKVSIHTISPLICELPPYSAKLIVSEDLTTAGFSAGTAFVTKLFNGLRPYGGNIWLYTTSTEHTSFQGWVSSLSLAGATVSRNGTYSVLQRNGKLPGSTDFVKPSDGSAPTSPDEVAKAPFGILWWDDSMLSSLVFQSDFINGSVIERTGRNYDIYNGLPRAENKTWTSDLRKDPPQSPSTGSESMRINPFNGLSEPRTIWHAYGCGGGESFYGKLGTFRDGTIGYYDFKRESGAINIGGMRPACGNIGMIPANGVLVLGATDCNGCEYPLGTVTAGMIHRPAAQEFGAWGYDRTSHAVEDQPIRKVAFNFGAIGDRHESGTLWLHRPYSTRPAPDVPVFINPAASVERYSHHTSWVQGSAGYPWVASTGLKGMNQITVNLTHPTVLSLTAATPPTIDGSLSDSCWSGAGKITLYHMNYSFGKTACENPIPGGEIQIRHDASKLYVSCKYISGDVMQIYKEAGWDIWLSDRVKLNTKAIHLRVDRNNVKFDGMSHTGGSDEDAAWTGTWSGDSTKTTSQFIVEFSIPWTTLTSEGFDKTKLIMNVQGPGTEKVPEDVLHFRSLKSDDGGGLTIWKSSSYVRCDLFSAVSFDTIAGDLGKDRTYTVRMHFTEPDDLAVGQRKFDIAIQGATKLTDFDVVAAAGGARKAVIKEFTGITIKDILTVNFTPKVGTPVISGMEILESGSGGPVDTTAPSVPTGLTASAASSSQINLSWTASTDAVGVMGYKIYRGGTEVGTSSGTTYSDTGLTASTAYSYKVAAYDAAGNTSGQSTAASATTSAPAGDTTAPTVPTGLTASAGSSSQINLSWIASTDAVGVAGYKVYRGGTLIGTATGTTYSNAGLTASTTYSYKVSAYDAAGNESSQSSAASATTLAATSGDTDADGLPDSWETTHFGSPSDPRAQPALDPDGDGFSNESEFKAGTSPVSSSDRLAVTDELFPTATSFKFTWKSIAGKSYEVQSSSDMVTWTTVTTVAATSTSTTWTNSGLSGVGKKFYRVRIP